MKAKLFCALVVLAVTCGCGDTPPPTTPNINIDIDNVAQNNGGGSGSVQPGSGSCAVASLKGGIFGDAGGSACAGRLSGGLKVGCRVDFTVTPKTPAGTDASPVEHGDNLTVIESEGSTNATLGEDSDNPFNFQITPTATGQYALKATLNAPGCPAIERTYQFDIAS